MLSSHQGTYEEKWSGLRISRMVSPLVRAYAMDILDHLDGTVRKGRQRFLPEGVMVYGDLRFIKNTPEISG